MKTLFSTEAKGLTIKGFFEGEAKEHTFTGKKGDLLIKDATLMLGLGKKEEFTKELARIQSAHGVKYLRKHNYKAFSILALNGWVKETAEGVLLGLYQFLDFKTELEDIQTVNEVTIVGKKEKESEFIEAQTVCTIVNTIRTIQNTPSNVANPEYLAIKAMELAKTYKLKATIWDKKEIEKRKMGGVLAVSQGSANEPKFIILEYKPSNAKKHIALVGKGVTFDSGGISLKPGAAMDEMKFDMSGAAAVMGSICAASSLKLPVHITALMPCVENMPDGKSYRPGDIISMMSGKTTEVLNTDAEGRMILADALHFASTLKPNTIIDFATLTGACVIALGHHHAGLFTNTQELVDKLLSAGENSGEKVWQLPLTEEYLEELKSEVADIKHLSERWGGAITAAMFLKQFVHETPWAHIDIAGTAWVTKEKPYKPFGGTGFGVRLMVDWLKI